MYSNIRPPELVLMISTKVMLFIAGSKFPSSKFNKINVRRQKENENIWNLSKQRGS